MASDSDLSTIPQEDDGILASHNDHGAGAHFQAVDEPAWNPQLIQQEYSGQLMGFSRPTPSSSNHKHAQASFRGRRGGTTPANARPHPKQQLRFNHQRRWFPAEQYPQTTHDGGTAALIPMFRQLDQAQQLSHHGQRPSFSSQHYPIQSANNGTGSVNTWFPQPNQAQQPSVSFDFTHSFPIQHPQTFRPPPQFINQPEAPGMAPLYHQQFHQAVQTNTPIPLLTKDDIWGPKWNFIPFDIRTALFELLTSAWTVLDGTTTAATGSVAFTPIIPQQLAQSLVHHITINLNGQFALLKMNQDVTALCQQFSRVNDKRLSRQARWQMSHNAAATQKQILGLAPFDAVRAYGQTLFNTMMEAWQGGRDPLAVVPPLDWTGFRELYMAGDVYGRYGVPRQVQMLKQ